jgi:glycosyltransferase involved in cell wall biosynthesis
MSVSTSPEARQRHAIDQAPEFTILMPCLNEAETLEPCIAKAWRGLADAGVRGEIVVADNGSTDGSQEIAERNGARVVPVQSKGYGAALIGGIEAARGRFIIMGDSDDSYDFSKLLPFVTALRSGAELVMGNRFMGGIARGAMPPLHRYLGNPVLSFIGRLFFQSPCRDFHCGMRGFTKAAAQRMNLRTQGMEFASEMVVKATILRMRIAEVPTTLSPDGRSRPPHLRSWRDGWRHLRFLLLFSPRFLFLFPGLALMSLGLATGAWLLPEPRTVGPVTLDIHTLLFAGAAVLLGVQAVLFWFFAKVFAISEGLLPDDPRITSLGKAVNLEVGLVTSGVALLAGITLAVHAVGDWGSHAYGILNPSESMRVAIPGVVLMILGFEGIFASFFLSVLALKRR